MNGNRLSDAQQEFAFMTGLLLHYLQLLSYRTGKLYAVTYGETYRSPEEARRQGFSKSLHTKRLAVDWNLFIDGVYQTTTAAHKPIGEFWESIGGSWGGRFNDGNHYSRSWKGVK